MKQSEWNELVLGNEYHHPHTFLNEHKHLEFIKKNNIKGVAEFNNYKNKPSGICSNCQLLYKKFPNIKIKLSELGWKRSFVLTQRKHLEFIQKNKIIGREQFENFKNKPPGIVKSYMYLLKIFPDIKKDLFLLNWKIRGITLTESIILNEIKKHKNQYNEWPKSTTRKGECAGFRWPTIDLSLRYGRLGLKSGKTLSELVEKISGESNKLTIEFLKKEIKQFFKKYNKYPTQYSKEKLSDGSTWRAINSALRRGNRGLKGDSSLAQLTKK